MKNEDIPAFGFDGPSYGALGLTKKEYAAIHCLAGLLARSSNVIKNETYIKCAIQMADDLLQELEPE